MNYINQLGFCKYKVKVDFWTTLVKQLHDRLLTSVSKQFMVNKKNNKFLNLKMLVMMCNRNCNNV